MWQIIYHKLLPIPLQGSLPLSNIKLSAGEDKWFNTNDKNWTWTQLLQFECNS